MKLAMKLKVSKVDMWAATLEDRAGGAADKLEPLVRAGADFDFVLARRTPEQPGQGLVFVSPVKGAKAVRAGQEAGFAKAASIHSLRIEGANRRGTTAGIARALADAGISFRALSATGIGRKFVTYLALDTAEQAASAASVLRRLG